MPLWAARALGRCCVRGHAAYGFRGMPSRTVSSMPSPVSPARRTVKDVRGFTLIELVIVIVVLGIISAIAITGYQAVISRSEETTTSATLSSLGREVLALSTMMDNDAPTLENLQEVLVYDTPGQDGPNPGDQWTAHDTLGGFSSGPDELHFAAASTSAGIAWQHSPGECTLVKMGYETRPEWSGALSEEQCTGAAALLLPVEPGS